MKLLALCLALCGFCFAQSPRGASTHQVSVGACSVNASNVHGNVTVSINGPACNNLSKANMIAITRLVELLQEDIEARKSQPPALTDYGTYKIASAFNPPSETMPACSNVPTIVGSPGSSALESLNRNLGIDPMMSSSLGIGADQAFAFKNISTLAADNYAIGQRKPIGLLSTGDSGAGATLALASISSIPVGTDAFGTGADQAFAFKNISALTADDRIIGQQPSAGFVLTGDSGAGATLALASISSIPLATSAVTGADQVFAFKNISGLAADNYAIGRQQPIDLLSTGDPTAGATLALASFSNTPLGTSPIGTGADQALAFKNISALTADDHIIGQQPSAGFVFTGGSAVAPTLDSVSLTFKNTAAGSSSIITGTDYLSSSKSLSTLAADDHIIGQQPSAGFVFTGGSAVAPTLDSVSLTFTSTAAGSSSIITGTDYLSLSKSVSDLTSCGQIITGWTITYLPNKPR